MSFEPKKPVSYSRRAAVGLLLAGLTGSAATTHLVASSERKRASFGPQSKPVPLVAKYDWPEVNALAQHIVDQKVSPAVSVSVMREGALLYSRAFGTADFDTGVSATPQTGFRIASISKQFTAAAIMVLAEAGALSVDDPLSRFLFAFPRAGDITLRQMMSHTAGLGDYINGKSDEQLIAGRTRDFSADELLRFIENSRPLYRARAGERWAYSNSGFALLGIVVERLSGMSLGDFSQKHLFARAGMINTAIDPSCQTLIGCAGYRNNFRAPHGFDRAQPLAPSFIGGAGAMRSTTEDLVKWHDALFNGKILKPESVQAMLTPQLLNNGKPALERGGPDPLEYGFGLGLGKQDEAPFAAHGGRVNGFTGHLRSLTGEKLSVAILYNCDCTGAAAFTGMHKRLRAEAFKQGLAAV